MSLEAWVTRTFGDDAPAHFGSGWISGTLSVFLGALSVFTVLCLRYPGQLVSADFRGLYPLGLVRAVLELMIGLAFLLGFLSAVLRRRKVLAVTGISAALLAVLLGGSDVPLGEVGHSRFYLGLDWFVLTLLVLTSVFVPLERLFPFRAEQSVFRRGWVTDLAHFFISHLAVQLLTYLTLLPSTVIFAWLTGPGLQARVQSQPLWLQVVEILIVADLAEYSIHRLFHVVPWLWRFHAVHHSAESMDWIAGSRLHVLDIVLVRGFTFLPVYLLGFSPPAVYAYLLFVAFHGVFLHANVGFRLGPLEHLLAMPRFHHWHHSSEPEAIDKNFALHFPWIDQLFGTKYLPAGRWPSLYGVVGYTLPLGWWAQLLWPLRKAQKPLGQLQEP
jgi:sterol desaturase/sphingolipid hydroxylase (fatty acid hydroxylase superfamily)